MRPPAYYPAAANGMAEDGGVEVANSNMNTVAGTSTYVEDSMVAESVVSAFSAVSGYDSDEPPTEIEMENEKLLWRLDPKRSGSDWKLVVTYEIQSELSPPASPASTSSSSAATRDEELTESKKQHKTDIYHVHQLFLSTRSRKSEYFSKLFKRDGDDTSKKSKKSHLSSEHSLAGCIKSSKSSRTSYITLPTQQAAKVLPIVLDYIYSIDVPLSNDLITAPEIATALYYMSGLFDIRRLRWESKQYWLTDLRSETCPFYYNLSKVYQEDKITHAIIIWCATNILDMDELTAPDTTSSISNVHDGDEFWMEVVQYRYSMKEEQQQHRARLAHGDNHGQAAGLNEGMAMEEEDVQVSLHLSQLLYCHFGSTIDIVDEKRTKAFKFLTQSKYLPIIHRDVAISLLDLERTIVIRQQQEGEAAQGERHTDQAIPSSLVTITDLQKRCIQSLTSNWKKIGGMDISELTLLQRQSPIILTELLLQVSQIGHTEIQQTREELASSKKEVAYLNKELKKERHKAKYKKQVISNSSTNALGVENTIIAASMSSSVGDTAVSLPDSPPGDSTESPTSVIENGSSASVSGHPLHQPILGHDRSSSFGTPPRRRNSGSGSRVRLFRNPVNYQAE